MPAKGTSRFEPTAEQRQQVEMYSAVGLTQAQIAELVGCSVDTLDRHFRRELDLGLAKANAKVAGTLFNKAMQGDNACLIFWLKTRARWKEVQGHELSGPEGNAISYKGALTWQPPLLPPPKE